MQTPIERSEFRITIQYTADGRLRAMVGDGLEYTALDAPAVPADHPTRQYAFRATLDAFFQNLTHILRRRAFPNDTLVYDVRQTSTGPRYTHPRYPGDK